MEITTHVSGKEWYKQIGLTRLKIYPLTPYDQGFATGFLALFGNGANPYTDCLFPSERQGTPYQEWQSGWFDGNSTRCSAGR